MAALASPTSRRASPPLSARAAQVQKSASTHSSQRSHLIRTRTSTEPVRIELVAHTCTRLITFQINIGKCFVTSSHPLPDHVPPLPVLTFPGDSNGGSLALTALALALAATRPSQAPLVADTKRDRGSRNQHWSQAMLKHADGAAERTQAPSSDIKRHQTSNAIKRHQPSSSAIKRHQASPSPSPSPSLSRPLAAHGRRPDVAVPVPVPIPISISIPPSIGNSWP